MKNLITFLLVAISFISYSQKKDYTLIYQSDSIIKKGISLHDNKKYSEAINEYNKISKLDPDYLRAQSEIAFTLSETEKKQELKKLFEDLYKSGKMKDFPELYTRYGSFLDDESDFVNAEKIYKEGEKYMPNNSSLLYNYAVFLVKAKRNQEAVDTLKKLIDTNPNYASAHYLIGYLAFENGNVTEGALAMITYLTAFPTGRFSLDAIKALSLNFGDNYLKKGDLTFSKTGDDFTEIDEILRNKFPLNKNYKLKSDLDDIITRQVQAVVEYAAEHKMGDGFFETTYTPWMNDAVKSKQVENHSYCILVGIENSLGKKLTSQKKKIENFYTSFIPTFWKDMTMKKLDFYGKKEEVSIVYKDNKPFLIGKVVNDKKEGKFIYLDDNGNKLGDLFYKDNELDGAQKYYYTSGNLSEEKSFKNGKIDGLKKSYFENGQLSSTENYKDGKLNGTVTLYKFNGGKSGELNFKDDEKDGKFIFYYPNQTKKTELTYVKGKVNGDAFEYNELGDITTKSKFIDGEFDGQYTQYYDGKIIKTEGLYEKGKVKGSFKTYYSNGALEKESVYVNGKLKKIIEYIPNGKLSQESFYTDDEDRETVILYDNLGEKFFEEKYKRGELKSGLQYFANGQKPKEINLSKKAFEIFNLDGTKYVQGEFEKGRKTGEWTYFYANGNMKIKENFKNGMQNGMQYNYRSNGDPSVFCYYVDDELNGLHETYNANGLVKSCYYVNNEKNGPSTNFSYKNKIIKEEFYNDNELNTASYSYYPDGSLSSKTTFKDNNFTNFESYNDKGEVETNFDYVNKTGDFSMQFNGGMLKTNFSLKNGEYDGKYESRNKLNNIITQSNYVNGNLNGSYKHYNPNSTLSSELNYYNSQLNGQLKYYDLLGNLRLTYSSNFGNNTGITTRYNVDKTKIYEYNEVEDNYQGDYKWYNKKGENILTIVFENDIPLYFLRMDKQGQLSDKVLIVNQTADLISTYPNGKKAINLKFVKGQFEGKLEVFNSEGQQEYIANYAKNLLQGERIEKYPSGKIYKKEHFKNGNFDGLVEYFSEDGKKLVSAQYADDEFDGPFEVYENGVLKTKKIYRADELIEIVK